MNIATFIARNPRYTLNNIRALAEVRRAMNSWLVAHPACAYCGKIGGQQVHHKIPVNFDPIRAADSDNFMTLCGGKRGCHFIVGHASNWRGYVKDPQLVCNALNLGGKV